MKSKKWKWKQENWISRQNISKNFKEYVKHKNLSKKQKKNGV